MSLVRALHKLAAAKPIIVDRPSGRDLAADWAGDASDSKRHELPSARPADQVTARKAIWRVDGESVAVEHLPAARRWLIIQADGAIKGRAKTREAKSQHVCLIESLSATRRHEYTIAGPWAHHQERRRGCMFIASHCRRARTGRKARFCVSAARTQAAKHLSRSCNRR